MSMLLLHCLKFVLNNWSIVLTDTRCWCWPQVSRLLASIGDTWHRTTRLSPCFHFFCHWLLTFSSWWITLRFLTECRFLINSDDSQITVHDCVWLPSSAKTLQSLRFKLRMCLRCVLTVTGWCRSVLLQFDGNDMRDEWPHSPCGWVDGRHVGSDRERTRN